MGWHWWATLTSGSTVAFGPGRSNISSGSTFTATIVFGPGISLGGLVITCGIITTQRGGKWQELRCSEGFHLRSPLQTVPSGPRKQSKRHLSGY